jgi:hypothetical protein
MAIQKPVHRPRAMPSCFARLLGSRVSQCVTFSAPMRYDNDGDPVFSVPKKELPAHVALRECDASDMDFRILSDRGLQIDLARC